MPRLYKKKYWGQDRFAKVQFEWNSHSRRSQQQRHRTRPITRRVCDTMSPSRASRLRSTAPHLQRTACPNDEVRSVLRDEGLRHRFSAIRTQSSLRRQPQESAQLTDGFRDRKIDNVLDFFGIWAQTLSRNKMTEIFDRISCKKTFF